MAATCARFIAIERQKHAAQAHSNFPRASRIHQSLDKSRFIFRLSELETLLMKARQDTARFCCGV
jgi:hypothetical protein